MGVLASAAGFDSSESNGSLGGGGHKFVFVDEWHGFRLMPFQQRGALREIRDRPLRDVTCLACMELMFECY